MADEKLSSRESTSTINGGYFYIIIPDGLGGWLSRKISTVDLFNTVNSRLSALENNLGNYSTVKYTNKATSFTHVLNADENLSGVDLRALTGTPIVRIGSTVGGDEIMSDRELTVGVDDSTLLAYPVNANTTIYITLTGGTASITLTIRNNMF